MAGTPVKNRSGADGWEKCKKIEKPGFTLIDFFDNTIYTYSGTSLNTIFYPQGGVTDRAKLCATGQKG